MEITPISPFISMQNVAKANANPRHRPLSLSVDFPEEMRNTKRATIWSRVAWYVITRWTSRESAGVGYNPALPAGESRSYRQSSITFQLARASLQPCFSCISRCL